jgi:hypothetical protein
MAFHSSDIRQHRRPSSVAGGASAFKPRNYTDDLWSATLSVESFSTFSAYDVRPMFFSTPASAAASTTDTSPWDWTAELYPKGVRYSNSIMIGLWRNLEVAGAVYETVRLVVAAKSGETRRADVAILVVGVQDGVEYIRRVVERRCFFDADTPHCQINDIVPFHELNSGPNSAYLSGVDANTFKIMIVIKPVVAAFCS